MQEEMMMASDNEKEDTSKHLNLIYGGRNDTEHYRYTLKWITQKYPCLSAQEEKDLAKRITQGDKRARDILILSNIRLVLRLSRKYSHREGVSLADLIQDGIVGLLRAVEKFDWNRGHRFSTYACWWIQQAILQSFSEHDRLIRLPGHIVSNLSKIKRIQCEFEETVGRQPTIAELSSKTGISQKRLSSIIFLTQKTISLQTQVNHTDDGGQSLEDTIECLSLSPEASLEKRDLLSAVKESMDRLLNTREQDILKKRYMTQEGQHHNGKKFTLEDLGQTYGITRESVRQSEQRALRKIKTALEL
jgi:RNA polymerase primary sigma factor